MAAVLTVGTAWAPLRGLGALSHVRKVAILAFSAPLFGIKEGAARLVRVSALVLARAGAGLGEEMAKEIGSLRRRLL